MLMSKLEEASEHAVHQMSNRDETRESMIKIDDVTKSSTVFIV